MDREEFKHYRKIIGKTQLQMSQLLGMSIKAVHSYEQGWRTIPTHVERQMFFLISRLKENKKDLKPCWTIKKCPPETKSRCPAWEFQSGTLCWFINGTICEGTVHKTWKEKMTTCRPCDVFKAML